MSETSGEAVLMRPVRLSSRALYVLLFVCAVVIVFLLLPGRQSCCTSETSGQTPFFVMGESSERTTNSFLYNGTYPLTPPRSKFITCITASELL